MPYTPASKLSWNGFGPHLIDLASSQHCPSRASDPSARVTERLMRSISPLGVHEFWQLPEFGLEQDALYSEYMKESLTKRIGREPPNSISQTWKHGDNINEASILAIQSRKRDLGRRNSVKQQVSPSLQKLTCTTLEKQSYGDTASCVSRHPKSYLDTPGKQIKGEVSSESTHLTVKKSSGEIVRPVLKHSRIRRQPLSKRGISTCSKVVRFDSDLERVQYFLEIDRPSVVRTNVSGVESFPDEIVSLGERGASVNNQFPFVEWDIILSDFPEESPERLSLPVRLENIRISQDSTQLIGTVAVANLAFSKVVTCRYTMDYWMTTSDVVAEFHKGDTKTSPADGYDRFVFHISLLDHSDLEEKTLMLCMRYSVNNKEYWDNNDKANFHVGFRKRAKSNGKGYRQRILSRSNSPTRRNRKLPVSASKRRDSMTMASEDYRKSFHAPKPDNFGEMENDIAVEGESSNSSRKLNSADSHQNFAHLSPSAIRHALSNRYNFDASLSVVIRCSNRAQHESNRTAATKSSMKRHSVKLPPAVHTESLISAN